jgi:uncharacterized protein (TIGR00251 family)
MGRPYEGAMRVDVHVQPRASRNAVIGMKDGALRVALTAPPVDGAANEALIALLADAWGLKRRQIRITHGETSRRKVVETDADISQFLLS